MVFRWDPPSYGPVCAELIGGNELPPLGPGTPRSSRRERLGALNPIEVMNNQPVANGDLADCCVSALWLWNNFLDESHSISQSIPSAEGSYWHGIMHRREPDYSNAKYWFRRVGRHEIFASLCHDSAQLAAGVSSVGPANFLLEQPEWDPLAMVDLCQTAAKSGGALEDLCRRIAELEWQLLFDHCYRGAIAVS